MYLQENDNTNFAETLLNNISQAIKIDTSNEILDKYNLNWKVSKEHLLLPDGKETGFYGIVRNDTRKTFSTCKDSYVPFQNSELFELVSRIAEKAGIEIHSGGNLNEGAKVYMQLKTGKLTGLGENKTTVNGFATALNSHDGSTSLRWGHSNITICCRNTFFAASKQLTNKARHTESIHARVEQSLRELNSIQEQEKAIFDTFFQWAEIPVTREQIVKVVQTITKVNVTQKRSEAKDVSVYALNRANDLLNAISKETQQKGLTKWGLFSGVTNYTTHTIPAPNRDNGRLESKITGSGLEIDNEAFALVSAF
jgi:phage/plasmid-like protein (TIGR03299 family)